MTFGCNAVQVSYTAQGDGGSGQLLGFVVSHSNTLAVLGAGSGPSTPAGSTQTASIPLNPAQPSGTPLTVDMFSVDSGGSPVQTRFTGVCGGNLAGRAEFFNPGDNRVDPRPGDRLAIWCEQPDTLTVYGVGDDSRGFLMVRFSYKALLAAGPKGLAQRAGANGTVSASTDGKNNFWVAWTGLRADGQPDHGFAKGFSCAFGQ